MKYQFDIAVSIVAYKNDPEVINAAIRSCLDTELEVRVLVIDNSPTDSLKEHLPEDTRVNYTFNQRNVGFGKAHNQAILQFAGTSKYFLALNPDVYFDNNVLATLFGYLERHPGVGVISPKVCYPDGKLQTSRRLLPSPADLLIRRLPFGSTVFGKRTRVNEYVGCDADAVVEVPFLLGCFLLFRTSVLEHTGLFDARYFMYLEDVDICRRISRHAAVVYHGQTQIFHYYQRASSKELRLLLIHTASLVKYFNKWGWLRDSEREEINSQAIILAKLQGEPDNQQRIQHAKV